jgi:competence protein ComEC
MVPIKNIFFLFSLHPLLISTFFFMVGIWLCSLPTTIPLIVGYGVVAFLIFATNGFRLPYATLFLLFSLGTGSFLYQRQLNLYDNFYKKIDMSCYVLTGTVTDIQHLTHQRYKKCITLGNNYLSPSNKKIISTDWLISLYGNNFNEIQVGDTLNITNLHFKEPKNISFKHHLIKQGIAATVFLQEKGQNAITLLYRPERSLNRWVFNKKMEIYSILKSKMSYKTFSFFSSLFLGIKQNNYHQDKLKEHFKYWGLSHFLARSGIHLIVFIFLWKLLLSFIPLAYSIKQGLLIMISLIYFLLSWTTISFARALLTFLIYCIFVLLNRQINGLHILSLVALIVLIINPMQLFFLDFQLSFGLTFALLWFSHVQLYANKKIVSHVV